MKEFFGFGGYQRLPEGYLSWQHLTFVTSLMIIMTAAAVVLGLKNKNRSFAEKNKVLIFSAILIDALEIFKIVMFCIISKDPMRWRYELPLFLCSILLIAMPLAAFSKGRVREAAMDFVFIFGLLGAVLGTYGAGQNYGAYPVLSFDNVISGVTHCLSGFASLYVGISRMVTMKRKNIWVTCVILLGFAGAAMLANHIIDYNYMFLRRSDGTPYEILYNLVGGNPVLYPATVITLFFLYIAAFYGIYFLCTKKKKA